MSPKRTEAISALLRRAPLAWVLAALDGAGEETRVVGGAVRNVLLGRDVGEIDLATTAPPATVAARAEAAGFKVVPTGLAHGTLTILAEGVPFEVTTLREDVETDGRHATVRFGRDFGMDARRRDFTINALSVDARGILHDYLGGLDDLAARRVRFIGDPATRIREDYLRILRFFRFHAEYGEGDLDRHGFEAAIRERAGLAFLSRERVRTEFLKFLAAPRAGELAQELSDAGLLTALLGGVGEVGRLRRVMAWESEAAQPRDPVRRLAALAVVIVEDVERLREALRLTNDEHARLGALARLLAHLKSAPSPMEALAVRRLAAKHGLMLLRDALAIVVGEPRPILAPDGVLALARFSSGEEPVPVFPFRGADVVARGVPIGPQVGEVLGKARAAWLAAGCPTDAGLDDLLVGWSE